MCVFGGGGPCTLLACADGPTLNCSFYRSYSLTFCSHLAEEETYGYFKFIVFKLSCGCLCYSSLSRDAVTYSVGSECDFCKSYLLDFCSHLAEEKGDDYFTLIVFLLSCCCLSSVSLPRGAVNWSAIVIFSGHARLLQSSGGGKVR